ncbi:lipopolysaccharide biosynthesis protein [Pseudoduganella aquatica]|nr:hypothetical protein [Pseudoduganella aquatica]
MASVTPARRPARRLDAQRQALRRLGGPLLLSFANQGLSSGSNFLLGVYLARTMTLGQFGVYGACYALCMLYVGVGNALVLTQMNVTLPGCAPAARAPYAARMLCAVLLLGALMLLLAGAAALALPWLPPGAQALMAPLPLVALAGALFLAAEFFSAYAYLLRRERLALALNAVAVLVLAGGLLARAGAGLAPSTEAVLGLYALGNAAGCALVYACAPLPLRQSRAALAAEFRAAWGHGRWALGGVGVTWLQTQSYTYALAVLLGPSGAGLANLARLFIAPASFLLPAVQKIAIPRLAALRVQAPQRMRALSMQLSAALAALALLYSLLLLACFDRVAPLLAGRAVPGLAPLAALWCAILLFQVARSGGSLLLQLQHRFRALTLLGVPSAAVTVLATALLTALCGQSGALLGLLAGEITLSILIWKELRHAPHP